MQVSFRSLFTLATALVGAVCLFELAAEPLQAFSTAISYGLLAASRSTLFIAGPAWYWLKKRRLAKSSPVLGASSPERERAMG